MEIRIKELEPGRYSVFSKDGKSFHLNIGCSDVELLPKLCETCRFSEVSEFKSYFCKKLKDKVGVMQCTGSMYQWKPFVVFKEFGCKFHKPK